MQYSHKTRATSHEPWPWPRNPLADERRAARIAVVLVGGGRVEVGGWSSEAGQWAQLKEGLLALGLALEQQCNAPVRTG